MTVAMQGKFYQYKDNKGTNWPLYGNMQVMLSLGEGAFQCLLSIAVVIILIQILPCDDVVEYVGDWHELL